LTRSAKEEAVAVQVQRLDIQHHEEVDLPLALPGAGDARGRSRTISKK